MLNKVQLIGNLGKDPECRNLPSGDRMCTLRIATTETWRDKSSGEKKEATEWHTVVIFNENIAKVCEQYLSKGSKIYIEGKLKTRKWQDQQGQDRYSTEVVLTNFEGRMLMLSSKGEGGGERRETHGSGYNGGGDEYGFSTDSNFRGQDKRGNPPPKETFELDDEIPF